MEEATAIERRGAGGWDAVLAAERHEARPGAEWQSGLWRVVSARFDRAGAELAMEDELCSRLLEPRRALAVNFTVRMDDGTRRTFTGYRVQHTLARGPTRGGIRYAPGVSMGECAAMALWVTLECALLGLPLGGSSGGVRCDPHRLSDAELERMTRSYAAELAPILGEGRDQPAPDISTGEREMDWFRDVTGGDPPATPIRLERRVAAGLGAVFALEAVLEHDRESLAGRRVVVQGLGKLGGVLVEELAARGARIVGISDVSTGIVCEDGIDPQEMGSYLQENRFLRGFPGGEVVARTELLETPCDILVPAALEHQIHDDNARRLDCELILEAATGAITLEADAVLAERGIHVIPDLLAGSGALIFSHFESEQERQRFLWDTEDVVGRLRDRVRRALAELLEARGRLGTDWRTAATALAIERLAELPDRSG